MAEEWDREIELEEERLRPELLRGLSRRAIASIADETGRQPEELYRTIRGEEWTRVKEGSTAQEAAVRSYAAQLGYTDLRHFRAEMNYQDWDYYDVLRIFYGK